MLRSARMPASCTRSAKIKQCVNNQWLKKQISIEASCISWFIVIIDALYLGSNPGIQGIHKSVIPHYIHRISLLLN